MQLQILSQFQHLLQMLRDTTNHGITDDYEIGTRDSTKTHHWVKLGSVYGVLQAFKNHKKIAVHILRNLTTEATETWLDLIEYIEDQELTDTFNINHSNKIIKYKGSEIRVIGMNSPTKRKQQVSSVKVGIKSVNVDLVMIISEEASDIKKDWIDAYYESIKGANEIVKVYLLNPWDYRNDHIEECNKLMPFSKQAFIDSGYDRFKQVGNVIVHYSGHQNNIFLSQDKRDYYERLKEINPKRSDVVNYCMPAMLEGLIYEDYLDKIIDLDHEDNVWYKRVDRYFMGIDWGEADAETIAILGGMNTQEEYISLIDIYEHSPEKLRQEGKPVKDAFERCEEIIDLIQTYASLNESIKVKGIEVLVDNANATAIQVMRKLVIDRRLHYIDVKPCIKYHIPDRIDAVQMIMALKKLAMSKTIFKKLLDEFASAIWDPDKLVNVDGSMRKTRLKDPEIWAGNRVDAFEYLICKVMYNLVKGHLHIFRKKGKPQHEESNT